MPFTAVPLIAMLALAAHPDARVRPVPVVVGHGVVALTGPWAFHTGDDPRWADPAFDDSGWEMVDLAAPPNSHDGDVGLTGYVAGWTARGHARYSGYAWYRLHVTLSAAAGDSVALSGPSDVEDAYQIFVNGSLLGGSGRFDGPKPVVFGPQPRVFPLRLSRSPGRADGIDSADVVVAVRVWASPSTIAGAPRDAGGIHIAPAIGEASAIGARYRLQWLEVVNGLVVEVALPVSFLLLTVMAFSLYLTDRRDPSYLWLGAALVATGLLRGNQAFFFWTQAESANVFAVVKEVILTPLALGTWMMAWYSWLRPRAATIVPRAIAALTTSFALSQLFATPYSTPLVTQSISAVFQGISIGLHVCFAGMLVAIVYFGMRQHGLDSLAILAVVLMAIALFAYELSVLHVPGIWFPFGVGVSRAQFAYAGMDIALFALLLRRHLTAGHRAAAHAVATAAAAAA